MPLDNQGVSCAQKTQQERDEAFEELVKLEREVMLWERKITLEKEMQRAIDPSIGQASWHHLHRLADVQRSPGVSRR